MGSHKSLPEMDMLGDRPIMRLPAAGKRKKASPGLPRLQRLLVFQMHGSPKRPGNADCQRGAEQIDHVIVEASAALQQRTQEAVDQCAEEAGPNPDGNSSP